MFLSGSSKAAPMDCSLKAITVIEFLQRRSTRGLLRVSGHDKNWRAEVTERGNAWPAATKEDDAIHERWEKLEAAEAAERLSSVSKNGKASKPRETRNPHLPAPSPKPPTAAEKRRRFTHDLIRQLIAAGGTLTIPAAGWTMTDRTGWSELRSARLIVPMTKRSVSAALVMARRPPRSYLSVKPLLVVVRPARRGEG